MSVTLPSKVVGAISEVKEHQFVIATHNGRFHSDDCLAVAMLMLLPEYKDAIVVRTRDEETLKKADIVLDVGGIYDPENLRFDHHQRGFTEFFDGSISQVTKMSSAGMIFKQFGKRILEEVLGFSKESLKASIKHIYLNFMEAIDAIDNGVTITPKGILPLYSDHTNLSSRVSRLNEPWNAWSGDEVAEKDFKEGVAIAGREFLDHCRGCKDVWLPARNLVIKGMRERLQTDPSGRVIELETGCPFFEHLVEIEAEEGIEGQILYVFYPNVENQSSWRVAAVRKSPFSFENRLPLPESLRGLRNFASVSSADLTGVTFVHHSGFLAGCKTRQACSNLIKLSLLSEGERE